MPKKKKSKNTRHIIEFVIVIISCLIFGALWWVKNNTALFTRRISEQDISQNNLANPDSTFTLRQIGVGDKTLFAPEGFTVSVFAKDIKSPRFFAFDSQNTMYLGTKDNDKIFAIKDTNNDGTADSIKTIDSGLNTPHSVYYYNGDLYLAEQNQVSVYREIKPDGTFQKKDTLIAELPTGNKLNGGGHTTRTIVIGPDKKIYLSVGSSCNVCVEKDNRRATIMQYDLDGKNGKIFAAGLRNTVGFTFYNSKLYGADMGRDQIGDNIPPEEINVIEEGKNYGWPYCYGNKINNPEFKDKKAYCATTVTPFAEMQAHSAPLGIAPLSQTAQNTWPKTFQRGFFVAFHGSWNRTTPTGFKVVWVDLNQETPRIFNFLTGWLENNAKAWGRPAGLGFDNNSNLYISDDKEGVIYKVSY